MPELSSQTCQSGTACNCIYEAHCDPARPGCRLAAGGSVNDGGGVCGPKGQSGTAAHTMAVEALLDHIHRVDHLASTPRATCRRCATARADALAGRAVSS